MTPLGSVKAPAGGGQETEQIADLHPLEIGGADEPGGTSFHAPVYPFARHGKALPIRFGSSSCPVVLAPCKSFFTNDLR